MNNYPVLKVKKNHDIRIINGSPWIFSNEIENFSELKNLSPGSLVKISLSKSENFAIGYFNLKTLISARILSYNFQENIDQDFFEKKFLTALALRKKYYSKPFYRLIHSEGDFLPGLVIDRFESIFVCQISTAGMENFNNLIISSLVKIFGEDITIILKNDIKSRSIEGLENKIEIIYGKLENNENFIIENDLKFKINITNGQKTGWFYDQRINREYVSKISKDLNVLDAFCYVGGFGVNAIKGQAKKVVFVDSCEKSINLAKTNCNLLENNVITSFHHQKVFDYLEQNADNEKFDLIILDPPAFIKSKKDYYSGLKGYEKLVKLSLKLLNNNSLIILNSCSHNVSVDDLIKTFKDACYKNHKKAKLIRSFGADIDHPIHLSLQENEYLKSLTFFIE